MSSAPVNHILDNPFFKFSPSPDDIHRRARTPGRVGLFGDNGFGSLPRGLAAASDTFGSTMPSGIVHKASVRRNISPMTFVMPDTRKCPCCKRSDVDLYCASCVNNVFFQPSNIRKKRSDLTKRKAEIGRALMRKLEEPARIQTQYYATAARVAELQEKLREKRESIEKLKKMKEYKYRDLTKIKKNVTALIEKVARHKNTINERRHHQQSNDFSDIYLRHMKVANRIYEDLSEIVQMEPVAYRDDSLDLNRVAEQIDDALSSDQNTKLRYNEVTKLNLVTQNYYLVNGCYVPSDGNYSKILSDIEHMTSLSLPKETQDAVMGLGYVAKFVIDFSKVLDVFLPLKENIEILCQSPIWCKDQFETSIFALHLAVILISLNIGVDAKQLSFKQLFKNLRLCREVMKSEKPPKQIGRLDHKDAIFREITDNLAAIKFTDETGTGGIECISGEEGWEHVERLLDH